MDIYCRVRVLEEVLNDSGTKFTSVCMKEVFRLLSIRQLTTSPYHFAFSELVKKFNGMLKQMLSKYVTSSHVSGIISLNQHCSLPTEWCGQEDSGFSLFDMLSGRTIKWPF